MNIDLESQELITNLKDLHNAVADAKFPREEFLGPISPQGPDVSG